MAADAPDWFRAAVGAALQRLIALGLPGTPPAETIRLTAQAWTDVLWDAPIDWRPADEARMRQATLTLAQRIDRWPAPRQWLDALPPRPKPSALPPPRPGPQAQRRVRAELARLRDRMRS